MKSLRDFIQNDAEKDLAELVSESKIKLHRKTTMVAKAIEGFTEPVITAYAKAIKADLIVMGTKGASGFKEVFLGSNAAAVIKDSEIPVLAVPNNFDYKPLKDIVLAVDDNVVGREDVVSVLTKLAKVYKAHVSVLHIEKKAVPADIDVGIDLYLSEVPHSFNYRYNDNLKKGIDGFVTKIDADLLCMIHRKRGVLENLFHRSVVNKEVFDSPVPLLVLYDNY